MTKKRPRKDPEKSLVIEVNRSGNGWVYGVSPWTEIRLEEAFPQGRRVPQVVLWAQTEQDFEELHRPFWPQIGMMLTGLNLEQIRERGGFQLQDPLTKKVFWEWHPESEAVTAG